LVGNSFCFQIEVIRYLLWFIHSIDLGWCGLNLLLVDNTSFCGCCSISSPAWFAGKKFSSVTGGWWRALWTYWVRGVLRGCNGLVVTSSWCLGGIDCSLVRLFLEHWVFLKVE
jgi:hypothetical protein